MIIVSPYQDDQLMKEIYFVQVNLLLNDGIYILFHINEKMEFYIDHFG